MNAHVGTSEGEPVCEGLEATFNGSQEELGRRVRTRRGRIRRKAFWIVRACAPHRAYVRRSWLVGQNRTTGNGARGQLTSRTGAEGTVLASDRERQRWDRFRGRLVQPSKARRVGRRGFADNSNGSTNRELDASGRVHRSWRQRIAAPRLESRIPPARTARGPERATPLSRCAG